VLLLLLLLLLLSRSAGTRPTKKTGQGVKGGVPFTVLLGPLVLLLLLLLLLIISMKEYERASL